MNSNPISLTGINMRNAIRMAMDSGCKVGFARRTGEYVVVSLDGERVRCNARRKDAPRQLTNLLNRIVRRHKAEWPHAGGSSTATVPVFEADIEQITEPLIIPDDEQVVGEDDDPSTPNFSAVSDTSPEDEPLAATECATSTKPETLLEQLRGFHAFRDALLAAATNELMKLRADEQTLTSMLDDVQQQIEHLLSEASSLGIAGSAISRAKATDEAGADPRLPLNVRAIEFLDKHPDAWFTGPEIAKAVGTTTTPSMFLGPLIDSGHVERRGSRRSTVYRRCVAPPSKETYEVGTVGVSSLNGAKAGLQR